MSPELTALIGMLARAIAEHLPGSPDALVRFPFGFEVAAARTLVRDGTLKAARIGRTYYARQSDVVALVGKLAAKPAPSKPTGYLELVGRR